MSSALDSYVLLRALVDELVRCGMEHACTSPGSRSAPLALSLANEPRITCHSHIDERCAGFFALGLAKATGLPVAVSCTSGTAAAELLAAAIEAREARVPLLLLTADRPPELRENGAGQAIDQLKLFGSAAKWFFELDAPAAEQASLRWVRTLACRAYWTALEGRPGAVHLNVPLREPLVVDQPLGADDHTARPNGAPYVSRPRARPSAPGGARRLRELVGSARRGIVVAGRNERSGESGREREGGKDLAVSAARFGAAAGWPLLADPLSGARRGPAAIAHYDALLRDEVFLRRMRPDIVLRLGDLPTSKPLRSWLADLADVPQVALDPEGAWQDPAGVVSESFALDPGQVLGELAEAVAQGSQAQEWLARWRAHDERAAEAIQATIGGELSEPVVAAELGVLLPASATLFVASSMPVREIETFWPVREDPPQVLCNRGANGIDGTVSSAFGVAAAQIGSPPAPVVLLIGDVALAHDIGGLLAASRLELSLTVVLIDNGGGGIFDFLPVANAPLARVRAGSVIQREGGAPEQDVYTRHIATPTGLDFSAAAALYGLQHERVADVHGFREALARAIASPRSTIVEVRSDRESNVELHRRVWQAVSEAIAELQRRVWQAVSEAIAEQHDGSC